jgi:mono/diheme cytochrome c family protein
VRGTGGKVGPDLAAALIGEGVVGIAAAMLNHYPNMRVALREERGALPSLGATEMDDLVAYLLFINFAREPGSPENGRVLFVRKGCARCHSLVPGGPSIGPPLGRAMLASPPIRVAQDLWNHGSQMAARMQQLDVPYSTFERHEMADLLAFLGGGPEALPEGGALPGDPAAGRTLFESKGCARCHVRDDAGKSIGRDFATERWYSTATDIAGAMWNHGPTMWARMNEAGVAQPRFEDDELAHVLAYLYLLRSAGGPGRPERGREAFDRKHCARCHGPGGPAPDLAAARQIDTPIHFAARMWNHAPRMEAFLAEAGLQWPAFSSTEVGDLVSYLRQRGSGRGEEADRAR